MTTKKNLVKQMLMSIATAGIMSFSFTACNDDLRELESTNPLVNQVVGTWYDEFNTNGVLGEDKNAIAYDKVVRVAYFEKDGTGNWFKYYISDSKPIKADAGHFECGFNYSVNNEGTVNIHNSDLSDSGDHARSWSLQNLDGKLVGEEDQKVFDMELANAEQQEYAKELFRAINGGFEGIGLNANDYKVIFNGKESDAFTYENWRSHKSIVINDDGNTSLKVDGEDWRGFSLVSLPNSTEMSENSNMPSSVWEDVWTAGSDWELAFNTCGYDQLKHGSYLGFYNKYKGIVRVFAYIDGDASSTASDHEWGIQMADELAQHSTFRYGVPLDRSIKDKGAIGQNGDMAQVTTPWQSSSAIKGGLQPSMGWWAFDIDLSVYRGANVKRISDFLGTSKDLMKLRCLGVSEKTVDLMSDMRGQLNGTIDLEKTSVSSSSGIFAGLEDVLGKANGIKELYDLGTKIMNPNPLEAIGTGIELAKKGCDLFGIDYGATTEGKDGYSGEISMDLTAEINTSGILSGATTVSGNASPSLKANAFIINSENCSTLGEGIWNIKNTPKVYVVNDLRVDWRRQDMDAKGWNRNFLAYPWIRSPFDGAANCYPNREEFAADTKPFRGLLCVFDPSNIEVELNPNIFPEGTDYKVTAVCGVRKGMKFGSTEGYRTAQGLRSSQFEIGCDRYNSHISDRPLTEAAFDGLYGFGSKNIPSGYQTGAKFDVETYNGRQFGVFGRGDSEFLLEPMGLTGGKDRDDWKYYMLPAYEVTVTVTVEHEGRTFVYSRTYLPEFVTCRAHELEKVYNNAKKADKTHFTAMYDSQVARIQSVREWIARTPISDNSISLYWSSCPKARYTSEENSGYSLIDGNPSTYWFSKEATRTEINGGENFQPSAVGSHTVSWVEFHTFFCNAPKSLTITCSKKTRNIPKNFRLIAKKEKNDKWETIFYDRINNKLEPKEGATLTLDIQKPGNYKYYRIECSGNAIDYSLAEFKLNY